MRPTDIPILKIGDRHFRKPCRGATSPHDRVQQITQTRRIIGPRIADVKPAQASFNATMPATISAIPATRNKVTGSPSKITARTAVPTVPMPTQTA